jgi:alcohol dehydrogenase class IV
MEPGISSKTGELLRDEGIHRVVVLMDAGIRDSGIGDAVVQTIESAGIPVTVLSDLAREPGVPDVDSVMKAVNVASPDAVVAIGGGSVLDVGKLCAVLTGSDASVLELLDGGTVPPHRTMTVLIPTTAGTGSEATKNAIIAIPSRNTKGAVVHRYLLPDLVLLDAELTRTLPAGLTATTGMDALCHAMECYLSKKANGASDLLALEAMSRIAASIRRAVRDGDDIDARSDMLYASYLAGQCITLSGTNAVHAMSYPLGVSYHIPHGESNAMLLASVMEYNAAAMPEKTKNVAECFGFDRSVSADATDYLTMELHTLVRDLGITRGLSSFGVSSDDIPGLVESAYTNRRLMDNNPIELTREQIGSIYRSLFGGVV